MKNNIEYPIPVKIAGVGRYLPERIVYSEDLEKKCGLEKGWCERIQGVNQRRWVKDETASYMGAEAAKEALDNAGMEPVDIDLIINASGSSEQAVPDGGPFIQRQLGLGRSGIPSITIHSTCLSFIAAFDISVSLLATGRYSNILIVSSEIASCGIDKEDYETYTLLGDGAAAAVINRSLDNENSHVDAALYKTYGDGVHFSEVPAGTAKYPNIIGYKKKDFMFKMDGEKIMDFGIRYVPLLFKNLLYIAGIELDEINIVISHQASKVALKYLELTIPGNRVIKNLDKLGNCIGASIPLALYDAIKSGQMSRGDKVLLTGPGGAGLSFAGIILTY